MNGSRIVDFRAKISLLNTSGADGCYIDVYLTQVSFWDVLVWNSVIPSECPLEMTTTIGTNDKRGNINWKTPLSNYVSDNQYKTRKTTQHYMKKMGTVYMTANDGGNNSAEILIPYLPDKCKRANLGMQFGVILHNDAIKNNGRTLSVEANLDRTMNEIPDVQYRLPYVI